MILYKNTFIVTAMICSFQKGYSQNNIDKSHKISDFKLGIVDEINSTWLNEKRILNIYFPEGYSPNDSVKYPVVYLLDGSADEDFIHVVGLYQYNNFPWINRIPKSIVVGIANVDRKRDFTFPTTIEDDKKKYPTTGGSAKFLAFLEYELQPYIEKTHKTSSDKTIIGQSLGGLVATEILFYKPHLFNRYIIVSPSVWWNNYTIMDKKPQILEKNYSTKTDIYIGVGKEGMIPGTQKRTMEKDAELLYKKIKAAKNDAVKVWFDYLPNENHATVTHQAVFNALRILFPKKSDKK